MLLSIDHVSGGPGAKFLHSATTNGYNLWKAVWERAKTVKSNVVGKFLDVSEEDPNLDLQQSNFQDDLDLTVPVREEAMGSKIEGLVDRNAAKVINDTALTITVQPDKSVKTKRTPRDM